MVRGQRGFRKSLAEQTLEFHFNVVGLYKTLSTYVSASHHTHNTFSELQYSIHLPRVCVIFSFRLLKSQVTPDIPAPFNVMVVTFVRFMNV